MIKSGGLGAGRPLEALGIDEVEERAYRELLSNRMATTKEIAQKLSITIREAQRVLDSIEAKGLASHMPERPRRYTAIPPKIAVEALISQRQITLERARSTIPELNQHAKSAAKTHEQDQIIEVITSRAALVQTFAQIYQSVKTESVSFQRAPVLKIHASLIEAPTGIRVRNISDPGFLEVPGMLDVIRRDIEAGEEQRVFPNLPIKMNIVDKRIGLMPLNADDQGGTFLLIRSSSLLDALCTLFEFTWQNSTPITFSKSGKIKTVGLTPRLSDATQDILTMLSTGLNDKAIAQEANVSLTTLNRRVNELMQHFNTRTRFQLGWRSALEAFPSRK